MSEREEKFERMLESIKTQYTSTVERLAVLKAEDKTKTATYRQLLGEKLRLKEMLTLYEVYGLLDEEK